MRFNTSLFFTAASGGNKTPTGRPKMQKTTRMPKNKNGSNSVGSINDKIDGLKKTAAKVGSKMDFNKAYKIATSNGSTSMKIGALVLEAIAASSGTVSGKEEIKLAKEGPTRTIMLGSDNVEVFSRTVETGVPTSKTLLGLIKENGKTSVEIYNSKNNAGTDDTSGYLGRPMLNFGTGFEQRGYKGFGRPAYVTYNDILKLSGNFSENLTVGQSSDRRLYASILNSRIEYMIRNQAAYLRAKVKVHLCSFDSPAVQNVGDPITAMGQSVFYFDTAQTPSQDDLQDKVPRLMQYGNIKIVESTTSDVPSLSFDVNMSNRGTGIKMSPFFRQYYKIVDTQTVILGPGDFLKYKHIHHYGAGVDLTAFISNANTGETGTDMYVHQNYFVIFEYVGLPCEISYENPANSTLESYIGTSPVVLATEITKQISYVNDSASPLPVSSTTSVNNRPPCHVRQFVSTSYKRARYDRRDFNLPVTAWSDSPVAGQFSVPVMTDRTLNVTSSIIDEDITESSGD